MRPNPFCHLMALTLLYLSILGGNVSHSASDTSNSLDPQRFSEGFATLRIANRVSLSQPSPLEAESKYFCLLQHDNGVPLTYFPNWNPGDKNAIYFDPENCGVPYPFPFQITNVEFLLYNQALVDSSRVRFSLWTAGADLCSGPQSQIFSSPVYTITSFYPNWASVSLPDRICLDGPFFFAIEYFSGEQGKIPGVVCDAQQNMVDTCHQWIWYAPQSPPWREWDRFWNDPHPGWLMLRVKAETYSLVCDSGWVWLNDNGYAPSGAPDVEENQQGWTGRCGPVAIGNSLEWFGVPASLGWGVPEFVDTLANYLHTDSGGTEVHSMRAGIDALLNDFSVPGLYSSIWPAPDLNVMAESLRVSQTVVLLLGFWWSDSTSWFREGGHFVTMSGVKSSALKIALSDPARDAAEYGWPGRVRPADHPTPPYADTLHNDLQYVSHDIYQSSLSSPSPGARWQLTNYLQLDPNLPRRYQGKNFPLEFLSSYQPAPPQAGFVTEVEYAVMICSQQEHMYWEPPYSDYAPSGMPDFSCKQDGWTNAQTGQPTFSGPVAVANSFWWLDSKFNRPPGSMGDGMDRYPLVRDYLGYLSPYANWDDHDLFNVDHSATPWTGIGPPPSTPQPFTPGPQAPGEVAPWGELVERLAWQMDTDGKRTGDSHVGTEVQDMQNAIAEWFSSEGFAKGSALSDSLCVKTYQRPAFAFVESLVEKHENVILLIGFWYSDNNTWWRVGGHYVTVAGVNSVQSKIALSDPFFDNAETGGPGRVLSGSYLPHVPIPHTDSTMHNDPGNVSHDSYDADLSSPAPAARWWISGYPAASSPDSFMSTFYRQNVPNEFVSSTQAYLPGHSVYSMVEYAVLIDDLDYRGDVNGNGTVDAGDVIFLINYLFRSTPPPTPLSRGDLNCNRVVDTGDIIFLINYLFKGGVVSRCCGP
ncbi:MAG: dockerin type I domain-containing protein [Candidatus Zixiibacteriota bacterium]